MVVTELLGDELSVLVDSLEVVDRLAVKNSVSEFPSASVDMVAGGSITIAVEDEPSVDVIVVDASGMTSTAFPYSSMVAKTAEPTTTVEQQLSYVEQLPSAHTAILG